MNTNKFGILKTGLVSLEGETFLQALYQSLANGSEKIDSYTIYGIKGMVGSIFIRNIFMLETSGGKSLFGLRQFVAALEFEAQQARATMLSIYGSSVINQGFFKPNIAQRFGYSFERSGNGVFFQKFFK